MLKRLIIISIIAVVAVGVAQSAFAMMGCDMGGSEKSGTAHAEDVKEESAAVEVGNETCPVSGEKMHDLREAVQVEHEGKIYNLCCGMCQGEFKKDPEGYIKKLDAGKED